MPAALAAGTARCQVVSTVVFGIPWPLHVVMPCKPRTLQDSPRFQVLEPVWQLLKPTSGIGDCSPSHKTDASFLQAKCMKNLRIHLKSAWLLELSGFWIGHDEDKSRLELAQSHGFSGFFIKPFLTESHHRAKPKLSFLYVLNRNVFFHFLQHWKKEEKPSFRSKERHGIHLRSLWPHLQALGRCFLKHRHNCTAAALAHRGKECLENNSKLKSWRLSKAKINKIYNLQDKRRAELVCSLCASKGFLFQITFSSGAADPFLCKMQGNA